MLVVDARHHASEHLAVRLGEILAAQVLDDALLDGRLVALEVEERAQQIQLEVREGGQGAELVGRVADDLMDVVRVRVGLRQAGGPLATAREERAGELHQSGAGLRGLAVGQVERLDEVVEDVAPIVGRGRRHLHVAHEPERLLMDAGTKGADEVRLAAAGLAEQQQDAPRVQARWRGGTGEQALEGGARLLVDPLHVERIGPPDLMAVLDGVEDLGAVREEGGEAEIGLAHREPLAPARKEATTRR